MASLHFELYGMPVNQSHIPGVPSDTSKRQHPPGCSTRPFRSRKIRREVPWHHNMFVCWDWRIERGNESAMVYVKHMYSRRGRKEGNSALFPPSVTDYISLVSTNSTCVAPRHFIISPHTHKRTRRPDDSATSPTWMDCLAGGRAEEAVGCLGVITWLLQKARTRSSCTHRRVKRRGGGKKERGSEGWGKSTE